MNLNDALILVRLMIDKGEPEEKAINNEVVPDEFRKEIKAMLESEKNIVISLPNYIIDNEKDKEWFYQQDRTKWYYWPTLRNYLFTKKKLIKNVIQSVDDSSDEVLKNISSPTKEKIDKKGLVLGYVQSGKTSNYTAVIAKAVDVGYKLVIVMSGLHNSLRKQTQIRLKKELVGGFGHETETVDLPPSGKRWHEFTTTDILGDFKPQVNHASLQGTQPVLMVIKKNGTVLRKLVRWLEQAPEDVRKNLPVLIIDDESDQASPDTKGDRIPEGEELPEDYEEPSKINGLIRQLLNIFSKKVYLAYTATPFANILIPHDNNHPEIKNDLFPRDFIIDLPKPAGYFGAEELFGKTTEVEGEIYEGLDVIRSIDSLDETELVQGIITESLRHAILDFILAGSARIQREQKDLPASMLIHFSRSIELQNNLSETVREYINEIKDDWRYSKQKGTVYKDLKSRWGLEFKSASEICNKTKNIQFEEIEKNIGIFLEKVEVRTINSRTQENLDYELEPLLKVIAIGGDRLSRGLTLEGLIVSYFTRNSVSYDTLMQMGRWFGFKEAYVDLSRIYTTDNLAEYFCDLARVERQLRDDVKLLQKHKARPIDFGLRILAHPNLSVTNPLKQRYSSTISIMKNFSGQLIQTFKFPLNNIEELREINRNNLELTDNFILNLGKNQIVDQVPIWESIQADKIIEFISNFKQSGSAELKNFLSDSMIEYITKRQEENELIRWNVALCGRKKMSDESEKLKFRKSNLEVNLVKRSKLKKQNSIGVLTSPTDEAFGLFGAEDYSEIIKSSKLNSNDSLFFRNLRSPEIGLLLLYPISKNSDSDNSSTRERLVDKAYVDKIDEFIGMAVSFPFSENANNRIYEVYTTGTLGWSIIG